MSTRTDDGILKLAAGLLLQNRQISYTEIESLLRLDSSADAEPERIIDFLMSHFDAEKVEQKKSASPILSWETFLRLRPES